MPKKRMKPQPQTDTPEIPSTPDISEHGADRFPIVGIGASAGGLEALEAFFSNMPVNSHCAFVVIQHLDPMHKSMMASLLTKDTRMTIIEIEDGMEIQPDCIYLNPPGKAVEISDQRFRLHDLMRGQGIQLPVDHFFRSLAEEMHEQTICIILSGTGSDGTLGARAVKGAGGMIMTQDEHQAKYSGMPRSAIETGLVDVVLPVEQMPAELLNYIRHPYITPPKNAPESSDEQFEEALQKVFALIRTRIGHDFSNYKQTTLRRRIERRMAVHQIDQLSQYVQYLQNTPAEIELLFKDLLIGVTNFFRDPIVFETLREKVLPMLVNRKDSGVPVRVWSPGCSTGEEAYSLAIVLLETIEAMGRHCDVQIFASDLDADAIARARAGVYPESIAADVSPERLDRFFIKEENVFRLKKQIREMVVFTVQNLIKDPPFSKIDLVSCRNLLIYLNATLQKKLIPLFHYTLQSGGFLLLGTSESIGNFTELFSTFDSKARIFQRRELLINATADYSAVSLFDGYSIPEKLEKHLIPAQLNMRALAEKVILDEYAPPAVLINEKYDILYFFGATDKFLAAPTGEPTFNLFAMARQGLRQKLRATVHNAVRSGTTIVTEDVRVKQNGTFCAINVVVRPLSIPHTPTGMMMIVFHEKPESESLARQNATAPRGDGVHPQIASLEHELQATREDLQTTIEELETANEELKSMNEELQSVNEEMQSSNEELKTSKEELQSTNEELITVNSELQAKLTELSRVNSDINNLLASIEIGAIFLDTALRIKRFTPMMKNIFHLIATDIDRPISDITSKLQYAGLGDDAKTVLDTLMRKEREIHSIDDRWYSMRMLPYRTVENIIDGIVITFTDITDIKRIKIQYDQ